MVSQLRGEFPSDRCPLHWKILRCIMAKKNTGGLPMSTELELKYRLTPEVCALIEEKYAPMAVTTMQTTYYDTRQGALSARKWTLRRRLENGISICTLKTPGQGQARGEWEVPCSHIADAIPALIARGAPGELAGLTSPGLVQVCAARFTRRAATVHPEGATVELALDQGVLLGSGREKQLLELEIELKQGDAQALFTFGRELEQTYCLVPEPKSKFKRALDLAREKR